MRKLIFYLDEDFERGDPAFAVGSPLLYLSFNMRNILWQVAIGSWKQACIKVFGAWDPKKVPGNARKEYA